MLNKKQLGGKIKELREEKNMSQQQLADKVKISRAALSEIERGNRDLEAFELARIASIFNLKIDDFLNPPVSIGSLAKGEEINDGIKFKPEKLRQLILYILEKCGGKPNFGETVLYKLLYFIDFNSYEDLGSPVVGMNYVKLQFGPVPKMTEFKMVVEEMKDHKEIKTFVQDYHEMKQKRYVALVDSDLSDFSAPEKGIIDDVISSLSNLSATQIEAYSHGDIPWQVVSLQEIIPYNLVVDREPPYTKHDYWKMWQDAAATDTLKDLGPMSKEEYDYYANL